MNDKMIKVNIDSDERYPVYIINNECGFEIELSEDLYNKALRIQKEYDVIQDRLEEIYKSKMEENNRKRNTIKLNVNTIQVNVPTLNDRIYTEECMNKIVELVNAKIKSNTMFVTINGSEEQLNLLKIAATVTSCNCEDGKLTLECQPTDTPSGQILKDILTYDDAMNKFNVTPRIIGEVNNDKTVIVDDIVAFDIQEIQLNS